MSIVALIVFPILAVALIIGVSLLMKKYFDHLNVLSEELSKGEVSHQFRFGKYATFYVMAVCLLFVFLFSKVSTRRLIIIDNWSLLEILYVAALGFAVQFKVENAVRLLMMLYLVIRLYVYSQGVGWPNVFFIFSAILATVLAIAKPRETVNNAGT